MKQAGVYLLLLQAGILAGYFSQASEVRRIRNAAPYPTEKLKDLTLRGYSNHVWDSRSRNIQKRHRKIVSPNLQPRLSLSGHENQANYEYEPLDALELPFHRRHPYVSINADRRTAPNTGEDHTYRNNINARSFKRRRRSVQTTKRDEKILKRYQRMTSKFTGLVVGASNDNNLKESVKNVVRKIETDIWLLQSQITQPFDAANQRFSTILGSFMSSVTTNFHGPKNMIQLRRNPANTIPDVNSWTTLLTIQCLAEASVYGGAPNPSVSNMSIAVEALEEFQTHVYKRGSSIITMWPEEVSSDNKEWVNLPENILLTKVKDGNTFDQLQAVAKSCNCEPAKKGLAAISSDKLCKAYFSTPIADLNSDIATPPSFVTSFANLALGSLFLARHHGDKNGGTRVYSAESELWLAANDNMEKLIEKLKDMVIIFPAASTPNSGQSQPISQPEGTNTSVKPEDATTPSTPENAKAPAKDGADKDNGKIVSQKSDVPVPGDDFDSNIATADSDSVSRESLDNASAISNLSEGQSVPVSDGSGYEDDSNTDNNGGVDVNSSVNVKKRSDVFSNGTDIDELGDSFPNDTIINDHTASTDSADRKDDNVDSGNNSEAWPPSSSSTEENTNAPPSTTKASATTTRATSSTGTTTKASEISSEGTIAATQGTTTTATTKDSTTSTKIATTAASTTKETPPKTQATQPATTTTKPPTTATTTTTTTTTTTIPATTTTSTTTTSVTHTHVNQIINAASYYGLRPYLDELVPGGTEDVILIPSLISDDFDAEGKTAQDDGNIWHNGRIYHNYNYVDLMTTATTLHALVISSMTGFIDIQSDQMLQKIMTSSLRFLTWYMNHPAELVTMVTLSYFPSRYQLYWEASRVAFQLNSKQAKESGQFKFADEAINSFIQALRDKMTFSILQSITDAGLGQDGKTRVFIDDFIGDGDLDDKGAIKKSGDDRLFSSAMANNALINTWAAQQEDGSLKFVSEVTDAVRIAVNSLANYISGAVTDSESPQYNAIMSDQVKNCHTFSAWYPSNIITTLDGKEVDPKEPNLNLRYGVKGYIPKEEYQKKLESPPFKHTTRGGTTGDLNSDTSLFRFWSSTAFTKAASMLATSQAANLQVKDGS